MPTLLQQAVNIAQLQYNARFNEGQGRLMEANENVYYLKQVFGNQVVNNAMTRARQIVHLKNVQRARRVNRRVKTAIAKFIKAPHRSRLARVHSELNALRYVPVNTFKVRRGRSPSPLRSPSAVKKARRYS